MDYIAPDNAGRSTLKHHLDDLRVGSIPLGTALQWAIQVCHGMEHAIARGIACHRDLKPENILISGDGVVKISDFGLASAANIADIVSGWGTAGYIPPEPQVRPSAVSDVFAFGVVLYQMAAGAAVSPFVRSAPEKRPLQRIDPLPSPVWSVIARCLADAEERYRTFEEVRKDLEALLKRHCSDAVPNPDAIVLEAADLINKGVALATLDLHELALASYDQSLAMDSANPACWNNKGVSLHVLGRWTEAVACFEKALGLSQEDFRTWNNKGVSLHALGRLTEALHSFQKALEINPLDAKTSGNRRAALSALNQSQGFDP
jgi:serine/threonine protein kinase